MSEWFGNVLKNLTWCCLGYENLDDMINASFHSQDGLHYCSLCDYSNKYKTNVRRHVEANHVDEKQRQVQCHLCDYVGPTRNALTIHLRKHTSELNPWISFWKLSTFIQKMYLFRKADRFGCIYKSKLLQSRWGDVLLFVWLFQQHYNQC